MANDKTEDRRPGHRTSIGITVLCSSGREEGTAILVNLSPMGALLDAATLRPAVGDPVTLRFPATTNEDFHIVATVVVRHTLKGFAVQFSGYSPAVAGLISDYGEDD